MLKLTKVLQKLKKHSSKWQSTLKFEKLKLIIFFKYFRRPLWAKFLIN